MEVLKGTRIAYLLGCTFSGLNVDLHASRQFDLFVLFKHHAARFGSVDAFAACPHDGVKPVCCGGHVVLTCHYLPSFLVSHEVDGCIFPWYRPENHEPLPIITLKLCSDNSQLQQLERAELDVNCKQEQQDTEIFLLCLALWLWWSVSHEL